MPAVCLAEPGNAAQPTDAAASTDAVAPDNRLRGGVCSATAQAMLRACLPDARASYDIDLAK